MTASARGLFRATGKKSKPVVVQMLDGSLAKSDDGLERQKDDFYPTPPEPTRALLHAEIDRLRQFKQVWEPAAGDGAMVREMQAVGLHVAMSVLAEHEGNVHAAAAREVAQAALRSAPAADAWAARFIEEVGPIHRAGMNVRQCRDIVTGAVDTDAVAAGAGAAAGVKPDETDTGELASLELSMVWIWSGGSVLAPPGIASIDAS